MKHIILLLSVVLFSWIVPSTAFATHISGAEITYKHLGNDSFLVTMNMYYDCSSSFGMNNSYNIDVSKTDATCIFNNTTLQVDLQNAGGTEVSQICAAQSGNSSCQGGPLTGMKRYTYEGIIHLPNNCTDYTFSYTSCCRNSSENTTNGTGNRYYFEATLNSKLYPNNSSPEYTADPIPYVCQNQVVNYNYGVVENDGDSMSFELIAARLNSSTNTINYAAPYSATDPITGITINSSTGELNFTPTTLGNFVVVVEVKEYNGAGQIISTVLRDIQFVVLNCGAPANNIPQPPTTITNIVNTVGTTTLTSSYELLTQVGNQFCFDVAFTDADAGDVITLIDNATSALPGATSVVTGTNPATATICWTVPPGMNTNNIITFQAKDDACPINGSNSLAITVVIPPPSSLVGALVTTDISCNGSCDGTAKVVPSGGVGPYSYFWIPTGVWCCQGLDSISGLCPGGYILIVTDEGDPDPSTNKWDTSFTITDAPPMAILPPTIVDDDCSSTCVGAVSTFAFGGTAPRTFLWSNGATSQSIVGVCAGTYDLTVTDAQGCQQSISAIVQEPTPPTILIDSVDSVTCFGGNDGAIYARGIPTCGVSTDACAAPISIPLGTGTSTNTFTTFPAPYGNSSMGARHQMLFTAAELTASGLKPGTISSLAFDVTGVGTTLNYANYTIKMGCTSVTDLTGGWETGLTEVLVPVTHQVSVGWNTHVFDVKYFWDGVSNIVVEVCFNNPSSTGSGNALTRYTTTTNQSVLYLNADINTVCSSNFTSGTSANRPNVRFGNCESTFSYAWTPAPAAGQTSATAVNLTAQSYTVTVTSDGDGCTADTTVAVDQPTEIIPVITLDNAISCPGQCDAEISIATTGGQGPYTYVWDNGLPPNTSHTNLCAGVYNVTVTDAKNCPVTRSITITEPTTITATTTINTVISCNGVCDGNVTVNASGGTAPLTIAWPGGNNGATQGSLCAGSYDVTITDASGCFIVHNVILTEPAVLNVSLATVGVILCNGDNTVTINSTVTGGTNPYNYLWAPGGQTSPSLTNVGAGTYDVTVTDDHNCTATDQVVITEPTPLVVNITQTAFILCNGDATAELTAVASGATPNYTYAWSNGGNSAINTGIGSGTYSLTVTDANGCEDIQSFVVTEPDPVLANLSIDSQISCATVCDGQVSVSPSGGTAPYTVTWQAGMTNAGNTATNLCGGVAYDVTITDANNCQIIEPILLTEPSVLLANITIDQPISCGGVCDGQMSVSASGGTGPYSFSWSNGSTSAALNSLCTGTYDVTVTDANNCTATATQFLSEPTPVTVSINVTGINLCAGDQNVDLEAVALGGTPGYSYAWSNSVNNALNPNLGGGTYTVTATDANGCTSTAVQIVNEPTPVVSSHTIDTPISCNGICDGAVTVSVSGGTAGYTITWPSGATGGTQNGLCAGNYVVTIDDANGCRVTENITLTEPNPIVLSSVINTPISCNGVCDGDITISTTGGTAPITITWPGGLVGGNQTNLCANSYVVTATDANGCSNTITVDLVEPTVLTLVLNSSGTILCNGDNTVDITSVVAGGTANYTYLWGGGQTTPSLTSVGAGTYSLTVTDANGCTADNSVTINEPTILDVTISQTGFISCGGAPTASLLATGTGGVLNYSFLWSNNATTPGISSLAAGLYSVTITDANGCTDSSSFTVTEPNPIVANQTIINPISCNGVCDGSVAYNPSGGTPGYTYTWPAGVTVVNDTATGLCGATQYIVTITDANSCTINDTILLNEPSAVSGTIAIDNPISCGGVCDGQITASGSGGSGTYTYTWPGGINGATLTSACAGTFVVTITDGNGCTGTATIILTEPNPIVTSITQTGTILCFGDSTVTLTASTAGGTPNYSYLWNTGATTAVITNTGAGVYSLTTTDANNCSVVTPITVTEPNELNLTSNITSPISCSGQCDAEATVIATGGTPGLSFTWPGGANGATQTGLCAGDYVVTVTDANGCMDTTTVSIIDPPGLVIISNVTAHATCPGVCDGSADIIVTGGTAPVVIAWPSGGNANTETNLCAGTHVVTVTDGGGCSRTASIVINEPSPLVLNLLETSSITCNAQCDGVVSSSVTGGTAPYVVVWPGNDTTNVKSGLCAGTYSVDVFDANGCAGNQSITITEPAVLAVTGTVTSAITCNGICDGEVTATPTGGTAPYTISWPDGSIGLVGTGLCAGTFDITVTDGNGCNTTGSVTITEPAAITSTPDVLNTFCGLNLGRIRMVGTAGGDGGPYTYAWSGGTIFPANRANFLGAGVYSVTITDGSGCSVVYTETINSLGGPNSATFASIDPTCFNGNDGSSTVTAGGGTPPYTFLWSNGSTIATATGLSAGVHFVTITDDNGCERIASDTLINPSEIEFNPTVSSPSCQASCDGEITLNPTGGSAPYSFAWSTGNVGSTISSLCAGDYFVTTTDANNCSTIDTVTITDPAAMVIALSVSNSITCNGACDGEISASITGGVGPYSLVWSNGGLGNTAIGLCAGTHSVTVTDAAGCVKDTSITITEPTVISANLASVDAACGLCDGSITLSGAAGGDGGPYTFAWSDGSTGTSISNLCAGTYSVTITDGSGCTTQISQPINNVGGPSSAPITVVNPSCGGQCNGELSVAPVGGVLPYTFTWSSGGTSNTETGLCAGIYFVTVLDANGCVFIGTDTIVDPTPIMNMETIVDASCFGICDGSISLTTSGGSGTYSYLWNTGATSNNLNALCAGTYLVTTTDANGCSIAESYVINEPTAISVSASIDTPISCNGVCDGEISVSATGGTSPYSFLWSNGATSGSINSLCDGTYTVTITDANSCSKDTSIILIEPAAITGTITPTNATCGVCDGEVTVTNVAGGDGGPYNYSWSNGGTGSSILNLCPGTYDVTISDGAGCTTVLSSSVSNNGGPTAATFVNRDPSCSGLCDGMTRVTPVGGSAPYTYVWSNGSTVDSADALCAGPVIVTITDASGCIFITSDTLDNPTPIINTETIVDASCNGVCDGTISLVTTGGSSPYSYIWSDGGTGASRNSLCAGSYSVTTTDVNGCDTIDTYVVGEPLVMLVSVTGVDALCFSTCDGTATATVSGGTAPYSYSWSNGDTGPTASALCGGTVYDVTVTDAGNCTQTGTITIGSPTELLIDNIIITNPNCGASDGSLEAVVSGGTAPYAYMWNGTTPGNPLNNISAGSYALMVTDANGCTVSQTIPLSDVGSLTVSFNTVDVPCNGACLGEATATAAGGTGPFSYLWSTGGTTATITGLCAGQYIVTATDAAGGCVAVDTVSINQQPGLTLVMDSTNNTNCGGLCDGTATTVVIGGTSPITYLWSTGNTTDFINGLCAGMYTVTVTDGSGCIGIDSVTVIDGAQMTMTIDTVINTNCANSNDGSVQVSTSGGVQPYVYTWTGPNGFTSSNQNIGFLFSGTYFVTVRDANGCEILDTAEVGIITDLQVSLDDEFICEGGDSITLSPLVTGDDGTVVYQWYNLGGAVIGNDSVLVVSVPNDTAYYIVGIVSGGCTATDTAMVVPGGTPDVDAGEPQSIVKGQSVTIGGSPTTSWGGSTFLWSPSGSLSDSTVSNPIATPSQTTLYTVTVTNIAGCIGTDQVLITVSKKLEIISGFTPNGDGSNDYWELDFLEKYPSASVEVYNRWGDLIYKSKDGYPEPWDGTFEGEPLPIGTYYYVIDLKDGDFPDPISGPITIVR